MKKTASQVVEKYNFRAQNPVFLIYRAQTILELTFDKWLIEHILEKSELIFL